MDRDTTARARWALLLTSAAAFMVSLDALAVTTALPAIGEDVGAGLAGLQWTVTAYGLACATGIVAAAALGDRVGRRRTFVGGVTLFTAASVGCALAPTLGWLVAARAVQGVGAAAVLPLGMALLVAAVPRERRSLALGAWSSLHGVAVAAGPVLGGLVTEGWSWRWVFWLNVPVGLAVVAARRRVPEARGPGGRVDVAGIVLLSGTALAASLALVQTSPTWLAVTLALAVALVGWSRQASAPLLAAEVLRAPGFVPGCLTVACLAGAVTGAAFVVASYLQVALALGPAGAGLRLLPWTAAPLLLSPLAAPAARRWRRRSVLVAAMLIQTAGLATFTAAAGEHPAYRTLGCALLLAGVGVALAVPLATSAALEPFGPAQLGRAAGLATTVQRLGGATGVALTAAAFASGGFRPALATTVVLSAVGALAATRVGVGSEHLGPVARPDDPRELVTAGSPRT